MSRRSALWVCITEVWVALVAVLALAVLMAACSQAAPAPTAAPKPPEVAKPAAGEPTKAPAAAPAPTAAPAAKKVDYPTKTITMYAPSKPGSGFDTTARAIASVIEKEKLLPVSMPVMNASGSVEGIAEIVQKHKDDPNLVAVGSITMPMNKISGASPYGIKDIRPIANLISTYYGVLVRDDSPYKTLLDLMKDLKEKPDQTPITGGRSDDRIAYGAAVVAYGGDLKKINYAAFAGGTEASAVLLEGSAKAEFTTVDDVMGLIESKKVRVLAVSGGTRMGGDVLKNVPTFKEAGLNLEWPNFRYVFGGPQMPDYAFQYWKELLQKMVKTPTWKDTVEKLHWIENLRFEDMDKYLEEKNAIIDKVMADQGMKQ